MSKLLTKVVVEGTTTINHQVRCSLDISCALYVFIDCIEYLNRNRIIIDYKSIHKRTGLAEETQKYMFINAMNKGLIEPINNKLLWKTTKDWTNAFGVSKDEFEEFWKPLVVKSDNGPVKVKWTGAKPDALEKYMKARKIETKEYLFAQKESYFKMIGRTPWRAVMGCSVFLNVKTKKYSEDWDSYTDKPTQVETEKRSNSVNKATKKDIEKYFD